MTQRRLPEPGTAFCCSWSGGKDSSLAVYRALAGGGRPACLLTMLTEDGRRTRSHGLPVEVIRAQADCLGVPLLTAAVSWDSYEGRFVSALRAVARGGIRSVVFGAIDIERHRQWNETVCKKAGVQCYLPLWKEDRSKLLQEWWSLGFEAMIVVIRDGVVTRDLLGSTLDRAAAECLERHGVDLCGENGEYHTLALDGPIFSWPLEVTPESQVLRQRCWVQDVRLKESPLRDREDS